MPSISHRTDLSQGFLQRAKSGIATLPAGMIRGSIRWFEHRRRMRPLSELDDRLLRDIGLSRPHGWCKPDPKP